MYDEGKKVNPGEKERDREDGCEIERKKGRAIELSAKQREPRGETLCREKASLPALLSPTYLYGIFSIPFHER